MTVSSNPEVLIEYCNKASNLLNSGDPRAAEKLCRDALTKHPENPDVRCILAATLTAQGRPARSVRVLQRVLQQFPDFARAHAELGSALLALRQTAEAMESLQHAVRLDPNQRSARDKLLRLLRSHGEALAKSGNSQEAVRVFKQGLELDPHDGPALLMLGNELRVLGLQNEAIDTYETCIRHHPNVGEVYYSLANLKTYSFSDALLAQMEQQIGNESLPAEPRANFHFAVGNAYEDRRNYEKAFAHFKHGNSLRRKSEVYDADATEELVERIIRVFSSEFCNNRSLTSDSDELAIPIFIVGLPRSGSTLLEQVLASHSQVEGIGEQPFLHHILHKLKLEEPQSDRFPESFPKLPPESLESLGQQYLESTQNFRTGKRFFVDKMPNNFAFVGAIRMILPQAIIINARRHPLSSCVSSFKQLFYDGQTYSYDLTELARYYLVYQELMEHWHATMPSFVLDIHYEDVVTDQKNQTRRMLDFCGLSFEESCMHFYETRREIATASSEQVRQPIYTSSLDIWRPYEPYIEELIQKLKPVLNTLPPTQKPRALADPM